MILLLKLDVYCKIYVGKHLKSDAKEERVPAPQSVNEEERCEQSEEKFGHRVHAVEK